jgi:hypothetical protein
LEALPAEVLQHCVWFLDDPRDLLISRCVSRLFLALADPDS